MYLIEPDVFSTVNSVSWAPHELGAILACASSDGKISVLTFKSQYPSPNTPSSPTDRGPQTTVNGELTSSTVTRLDAMLYPGLQLRFPAR